MCDIEDVVRKITPVFNILNPFCPRLWHKASVSRVIDIVLWVQT